MIVINCLDISNITKEDYQEFYASATKERKKRADRYRQFEDAKRCIFAEALLRYSLAQFLKCENAENADFEDILYGQRSFEIEYPVSGKPYIKNMDNFFFNISHSGKWVVVAYGNSELGVDVEKIRQKSSFQNITNRFFTEEEKNYIFSGKNDSEKAQRFTRIWTLKESYIKFLGVGLARDLSSFSLNAVKGTVCDTQNKTADSLKLKSYFLEEEYVLSVCSKEVDIQIKEVDIHNSLCYLLITE